MDQVYVLRHKRLVEGVAVRQIAREMGISWNTVRKYLGQAEPVRHVRMRKRRPVFEQIDAPVALVQTAQRAVVTGLKELAHQLRALTLATACVSDTIQ